MQYFNLTDYDVVFLSYDEPNADANYEQLLTIIPKALRVHGVKGSDSAHKACAKIASTERIIIVDGDNWVHRDFTKQVIELDDNVNAANAVFSWPSRNKINGLLYGNGGIKCWPRQAIFDMRTHENAEPGNNTTQVDFCWELDYLPLDKSFSSIHNDGSKLQAWRAGFREGVKMSLERGEKVPKLSRLNSGNLNRLRIWMTVGADNPNGIWSILGARQGCIKTHFEDWDHTQVRDFDFLNQYYNDSIDGMNEKEALQEIEELGMMISTQIELPLPFNIPHSKYFKSFEFNPNRQPHTIRSRDLELYDIVMITYDEPDADTRFEQFKQQFPRAKRVHGVKGIHQAHITAAKLVETDMFWVVDGDAKIVDGFNFTFSLPVPDDYVRVWRSINPVNGLVYGYGGVKLLPRIHTINMDVSKPDMTTSISNKFIPVKVLSNVTEFNMDAYSAWKGAFRECCKLASKVIDRQKDDETNQRLDIWCTVGEDKPYGKYAIAGAKAGRKYGYDNQGNVEALRKINDFAWLKEQFNATA